MHSIKIKWHSWKCRPFAIYSHCDFVYYGDESIAEFRHYEDAKKFATWKANELGIEMIDEYAPIKKKRKKSGK